MIAGFTGTQSGMTGFQKEALKEMLEHFKVTEFCHLDVIGSDKQANQIALEFGIKVFTIFPVADGKKRGWCFNPEHERNYDLQWRKINEIAVRWHPLLPYKEQGKVMIDEVELFLAAPKEHQHEIRSGVWANIRYCWKRKKAITIIPPVNREI